MTATNITTRSRSRSRSRSSHIRSELELKSESEQFTLPGENTPHFFKFIHPLILQDGRLRIPQKFVGKYGKDLSEHVYLKVPNGNLWKVELKNSNGDVWLQNGWKEFAGHYSVDLCYILVFRYEGNSHFLVLIFDMSASEIEYPPPPTTAQNEWTDSPVNFEDGGDGGSMHPAKRKRMVSEAEDEDERPFQSAKSFTSKNPFFMVTLRPCYVTSNSGVNIQKVFADRYLRKKSENGNFTFQVGDGMRVWSVKWTRFSSCAQLSTGWGAFVQDNYLQRLCELLVFGSVIGRVFSRPSQTDLADVFNMYWSECLFHFRSAKATYQYIWLKDDRSTGLGQLAGSSLLNN